MAANSLGLNILFPILKSDGTPFHDLVMHKATVESVVMSLGDKITGDVYYKDNALDVTMHEYIEYKGVKYVLVNPPTILREGMVSDNSELKGMTKYSFVFYHPMYQLSNIPFTDVAVTQSQEAYLSENRSFSWIGTPNDFIAKLNTNLNGTQWTVVKSSRFPSELENKLSEVLSFDNAMIADALKTWYDTWGIPYVIDQVASTESSYAQGKRFKVVMGLPSNEIYESAEEQQLDNPFVFEMGKGVGLKNNSRTPRNNKIITRIAGYGSERNIPYGYPQIVWTGDEDDSRLQYQLYDGIVGGQAVKLIKHPFTRSHLMPSVYSERVNKKVNPNATGYNPNISLIDYYDATGATYPNNINPLAPSYDVHEFEDIYPELGNAAIVSATPLNPDLTPAEAWDDTMDDDGNYVQSYFSVALPQLSFDLYACAAITESMELNMRSGACLGCTFPVQVDWDEYKKNFYHDDGTFDPVPHTQDGDGHVRDITKFPKSDSGSITIILQKETQTFGTLMPNVYQYPQSGDNFVILGISLPLSYITNAESRLDTAMTSYMLENNVYYYDYPLKFDEHFLATHTYILQQIRPNTVVNFKFAGDTLSLFVKQLTVKYGEKVLPQYDITLTDNVDVVLNQIGRVAEDVEKLSTLIAILRQNYGSSVWAEIAKKLSKTNDDTAQGFIRFMRGLQVGAQYVPDILGTGGVFRTGSDGKTELVTDTLYVRMRAYFDSVVIREYRHESGNRIASPAQGFNCSRVEWIKVINGEETVLEQTSANLNNVDYFRCYWRVDDGEQKTDNQFIVGDLAFCENSTVSNDSLSTKRYWRVVVGRNDGNETTENGEAWIDVSNAHDANGNPVMTTISYSGQGGTTETLSVLSFESGSDVPSAHDDICMLGCVRDETRQGAIVEYTSGVDAPTYQIFQGIGEDATNPYVLLNKNMITVGYNTSTGRAMMNVYGDAYIGDPNGTTFLKYEQENSTTHAPKLTIKADVEFQNPLIPSQDTTLDAFAQAMIQSINGLQEQIDGEIDTWFYEGTPTLSNSPAVDWTTDTLKERHLGDLYYDIGTGATAGFAYRFIKSTVGGTTTYSWQYLEDTAITEALAMAAHAQDTADHKRRVFLQQPTPPYDAGDLWVNAVYPANYDGRTDEENHKYNNDLLKCITSKSTGSFSINDWALATKYTDDAAFNAFFANTYTPFVTNIQGQVDKKAETWYQDDDPSLATGWVDSEHVGDIWFCTAENNPTFGKNTTWIYRQREGVTPEQYYWAEEYVPDEVFDKIDGKAAIYVNNPNNPPTNYHANDLWILPIDATINSVAYKQGEILTATTDSATYNQAHWVKKVCYTDDTYAHGFDFLTSNLARLSTTEIAGGLVLSSLIGLRDTSNNIQSGINGIIDSSKKGGGIAAWYGGEQGDLEDTAHYTGITRWAKSVDRFDGSGYRASGNISWDNNGAVTIKNITTLSDSQNTNLLNELATFNNAFTFATSGQGSTTVLSITPQVPFTSLAIMENNVANAVATQAWVGQNYVSIAFFNRLFQAYSNDDHTDAHKVMPNDITTTITNLKLMVGTWTEQYLSALGLNPNSGGGGGGTVTGIIFQGESTPYLPTSGIITLPAYPTTLPCYYNLYWKYDAKGTTFTPSEADGTYDGANESKFFTIPEKTSQLTNDAGFVGSSALSGYLPLTGGTLTGVLYTQKIINLGSAATNSIRTRGLEGAEETGELGNLYINNNHAGDVIISGQQQGKVGIGVVAPTHRLEVDGSVYFSGSGADMFTINRSDGLAYVNFSNQGTFAGRIGVENINGVYHPVFNPSTITYEIWHSGTFNPSDYLPLAGGTMTGTIIFNKYGDLIANGQCLIAQTQNENLRFYTTASIGMSFQTGGANNRMIIGADGKIGIGGNASSTYLLRVNGYTCSDGLYTTSDILVKGTKNKIWSNRDGADIVFEIDSKRLLVINAEGHQVRRGGDATDYADLGSSTLPWETVYANSFCKSNSSNSYVLLGGGGHALVSSLNVNAAVKLEQSELPLDLSSFTDATRLIYTAVGGTNTVSDKPTGVDAFGVISYKAASGYFAQILTAANEAVHMYWRVGTSLSGGWRKILDSSNYTDLTVTKTGTGASGTWGISITGAAASAQEISPWAQGDTADNVDRYIWISNYLNQAKPSYHPNFSINLYQNLLKVKSTYETTSIGSGYIKLDSTQVTQPLAHNNCSIEFSYQGSQNVFISYTPSDTYRPTKGLKIVGSSNDAGNTWLEVEDSFYAKYGYFSADAEVPLKVKRTGSGAAAIGFWANNQETNLWYCGAAAGSGFCTWYNSSAKLYLTTDGKLGIGTTNPSWRLHVASGTTYSDYGYDCPVETGLKSNGNTIVRFNGTSTIISAASGGAIYFRPNGTTAGGNADVFFGNDYVGINTNTPSYKLHVNGYSYSTRHYLASGVYLEYDSANGGVHLVGAGLYADTYISALGANSSGGTTTFLTQDVADGRYLKLTGGTLSGNLTLDYQGSALLTTNLLRVTAIMAVNGAINTAYTLYVNGNARFNRLVIGNRTTVGTVGSTVIETLQMDAIYIKTGTAPNYVDGTWQNTSDIRLKEIVSYAGTGLEQIANAPIFNYRWRGDQYGLVYLGTSAQHWQDVFEHGVSVAPNGYLSMDYGSIALASAVITARKVLNHEQRIINLERENERLRQEINTLKAA